MGQLYLQTYSFFDGQHSDSRENLRLAADMGFDGVELFAPDLEIPVSEMKELLKSLNLSAVSMHAPNKAKIPELFPYAKEIGCSYMGLGMEYMKTDDDVHAWAKELNALGASARAFGLMMTYHNHTQEFLPCGGARVIDVLMNETDPALVGFELDAGWCAAAGFDPVEFVARYSGRVKLVHVKESSEVTGPQEPVDFAAFPHDENGNVVIPQEIRERNERNDRINCAACEGLVDWREMKKAADAHGCTAYIVEREFSEGDRVEMLREDIRRYRDIF